MKMLSITVFFSLIIGIILGFSLSFSRGYTYKMLRASYDRVKSVLKLYPKIPTEKEKLFLLGDSLIKRGIWDELSPDYGYINLGMGGARINEINSFIKSSALVNNEKAVLLIGVNDFADHSSIEHILDDYRKLITTCNEKQMELTVLSIPRVSVNELYDRRNAIEYLNSQLKLLATKGGHSYHDINPSISQNNKLKDGYTSDNLHLTTKAYREIGKSLLYHLRSIPIKNQR